MSSGCEHRDRPQDPRWGDQSRDAKARAILATIRLSLSHLPGGLWLDLGCGSGDLVAQLADSVPTAEFVGVDPQPWQRWQDLVAAHRRLRLHQGKFDDLPGLLGEASVDVLVCNQVYEHVESVPELLQMIHRMLKPGGICYFAGPNLLWPIEPHVYWPIVHWLPRQSAIALMRRLGSLQADDLDAWSLDWWRLSNLIKSAGLRRQIVIRQRLAAVEGNSIAARVARLLSRLPAFLFSILAPFAPGFVFILRKS
jgi:ubiquinone/menaquinone biosynthesis C-methylase UbiE